MKKVLVLDDDEGILDVIRIVLENNNYNVETVSFPKIFLEKVRSYAPDLILLDLTMPFLNAKKTINLIKKEAAGRGSSIPIILISATDNLAKKTKKLQASDFLEKPFNMNELLEKVKAHMG